MSLWCKLYIFVRPHSEEMSLSEKLYRATEKLCPMSIPPRSPRELCVDIAWRRQTFILVMSKMNIL